MGDWAGSDGGEQDDSGRTSQEMEKTKNKLVCPIRVGVGEVAPQSK